MARKTSIRHSKDLTVEETKVLIMKKIDIKKIIGDDKIKKIIIS